MKNNVEKIKELLEGIEQYPQPEQRGRVGEVLEIVCQAEKEKTRYINILKTVYGKLMILSPTLACHVFAGLRNKYSPAG
jgi:hypothetical protein